MKQVATHNDAVYEELSKIRGISGNGRRTEVLIEWDGLPDEPDWTWEPIDNVFLDVADALKEYLLSPGNRSQKQAAKRYLGI